MLGEAWGVGRPGWPEAGFPAWVSLQSLDSLPSYPLLPPSRLFGFVARKQGSTTDNACHLFAELDPNQPASAIVNFVSKVMLSAGQKR